MNSQFVSFAAKIKDGKILALLLAATLLTSGFFVVNPALAAHTATVAVDKTLVKGGTTQAYSFNVANGSGSVNSIFQIKITPPAGFTITGSLVCPSSWAADTTGNVATCLIDPFVTGTLAAGAQATVSFSATSPSNDSSAPWNVQTKDNAGTEISITSAVTTVDATAPTIVSAVTLDTDGNGSIDQAQVNFSENIDDATLAAGAFAISSTAASVLATGTANDSQITLNFSTQIAGTGVKTLVYTANTGADTVGNLLATVSPAATDQAAPVFLSARTIATNQIEVTFSESIASTYSKNDFGVGDGVSANNVGSTSNPEGDATIILTLASSIQTGDTPTVYFDSTWSGGISDAQGNSAVTVSRVATDNVAPVISSTQTLTTTTIQVTFSEPMSAVAASDFTVNNGSNAITGVTFSGPSATVILNLGTVIGTGETPVVRTVASPAGTFDNAGTPNTITGNLSSAPNDGIAPTVALTSGVGTYTNASQSPISVTATFSETVTGFVDTDITVDNGTVSNFAGSGAVYTFNVTPSGEGAVTISVPASAAQDAATTPNNNTVSNTISTIYDSIVPDAPVVGSIAANNFINNSEKAAIVVSGTAEAGATVNVSLTDAAGTPVTVTGSGPADGSGIYSITIDGTALADGAVSGSATATDAAANTSAAAAVVVAAKDVLVPAAPVITTIAANNQINDSEKAAIVVSGTAEVNSVVNVTLSDGSTTATGSGTANGSGAYSIIIDGTALADGTITPSATATDAAGNVSTAATTPTAAKDVTAPTVVITSSQTSPINSAPFTLTITFSESVSGFVQSDLVLNANAYFPTSLTGSGAVYNINVSPDGWPGCSGGCTQGPITVDIAAGTAQDAAGNTSTVATQFSITFDNIAPTVALTADDADLIVHDSGNIVIITATFNEAMTTSPTISINVADTTDADISSVAMTDSGDGIVWTYEWSVPDGHDGAAVVTVAGSDLANNAYAAGTTLTFTIDNTAPTATQATAVAVLTNDTTPDMAVNVESGASWIITDGTAAYATGTGTGVSQTITLSVLTAGAHTLDLVATDAAGNTATTTLSSFTIDTTLPTVSISSPAADSVTVGADVTLASTASDDATGATCQYQVDSGFLATIDCTGGSIIGLSDGRHTISLIATDGAGNTATSTVSVVIDTNNTLSINGAGGADFITIQEAVTKATTGNTLSIAAGAYAENVTIDKTLILTGTGSPTATSFTLASGAVVSGSTGITAPTVNVASGAKIQDGILLAATGGTVNAGAGTYNENLTIDVANLVLQGPNAGVSGDSSRVAEAVIKPVTGDIINITAAGVSVEGFELDGSEQTGAFNGIDLNGPDANILNNRIIGNAVGAGNNTHTLFPLGIRFNCCGYDLDNALIQGNYFTLFHTAVFNQYSTGVVIDTNTFEDVRSSNANNGVADVTYTGNVYINSWNGPSFGSGVSDSIFGFVIIEGNTFGINNIAVNIREYGVGGLPEDTSINSNDFSGTVGTGIDNSSGEVIDATSNWWGQSTGPADGAVVGTVDYRPWYLTAELTGLDQAVPTANSFVPSNNSVGISPTADVTATFSEAMAIAAGDISFNPVVGGIGVTFDSDTNIATITHDALADNTTYTVTIAATAADLSGNQLASTAWSFTTSGSYSLSLTQGWNLVSFPVNPVSTDVATVLGDAASGINAVWSYDPATGQWSVYRPSQNSSLNSLTNITSGYGYWVDYASAAPATVSGPGNLYLEGNNTPPQRTLYAGWNLIGYYQKQNTTTVAASSALSTLYNPDGNTAWWSQLLPYNNTTKQFSSTIDPTVAGANNLTPGQGYWVLLSGKAADTYIYAPGLTPTTP